MKFTMQSKEEYEKNLNKREPSKQEKINAQVLMDNASMKIELDKQKKLNAQLLLDVAKLKGSVR